MAQTFTPTVGNTIDGAQNSYPMGMDRGNPGQIADNSIVRAISGANETAARIGFGIPVIINGSGVLPNSMTPAITTGVILGITMRSEVHEKAGWDATVPYAEGIPVNQEGGILTQGSIMLPVWETVAVGAALRYFKSGANAGRWGTTASAGNSLNLAAGGWVIRRAGNASTLLVLEINTPGQLSFTAD
jgi:hypothetical protein